MAVEKLVSVIDTHRSEQPKIRNIGTTDVINVLTKGLADFNAMPTHLLFLAIIYPILMVVIIRSFAGYDMLPLVFPLIAGSTLLGPLAATGMYELSRRREFGLDISRRHALDPLKFHAIRSIALLGLIQLVIYILWMGAAHTIYVQIFGAELPDSLGGFAMDVLFTSQGWQLILLGSVVGLIFAVVVLTISAISFPMLLHRDCGVFLAIQTSIRVAVANPMTMLLWGAIVVSGLFLGAVPVFVGLAIVMPVLGHATWHLYRIAVEDD
jgi:uncharacterized membrane protein